MRNYTDSICLTFLHCVFQMFSQVACLCRSEDVKSHWLHLFDFSPLCVFKWVFTLPNTRGCIITLVTFVGLFSSMYFQMSPEIAFTRGFVTTLIALVWLFSTVRFQMCSQIEYMRGCIVTLVAFLHCVFSNVSSKHLYKRMQTYIGCICLTFLHCGFYMRPRSVCLRGCIVALVTFV